jgi:hypothetical protein
VVFQSLWFNPEFFGVPGALPNFAVTEISGKMEVLAIHDASMEECSMSGVEIFLVERRLGGQ